ncbi:hypothetical protein PI125_g26505 [Phytophthora idaei]|nr:hypothetical protein PI125_g26607 [Phytophthora idaei]KAG3049980.1 hypothetical protein PI125_g26505 [Phytophthora idaei]
MQHAAADRDDSSDGSLCRAGGLVRVRNRGLLLDAFVFVEILERVRRKLTSSVVPHKLDLLAELLLHLHDIHLDAVFAFLIKVLRSWKRGLGGAEGVLHLVRRPE